MHFHNILQGKFPNISNIPSKLEYMLSEIIKLRKLYIPFLFAVTKNSGPSRELERKALPYTLVP
jgi:hypothetical protein